MAMQDALRGIGNRHRFQMEGWILLESAIRPGSELAVIILDIDHFKIVNDRFGHPVRDKILCKVADVCSKEIRAIDLPARDGGEEFVLIILDAVYPDPLGAAERIRTRLENTVHPETAEAITSSLGIYSGRPAAGEKISRLLVKADKGLYEAKRFGKEYKGKILPLSAASRGENDFLNTVRDEKSYPDRKNGEGFSRLCPTPKG